MFCPFCGKEISNQARFCGACGKSLALQEAPSLAKNPMGDTTKWYYIFGAVFILLGILPYLLRGDSKEYSELLWIFYNDGIHATMAVNCISQFLSSFLSLFRFSSSVLTVYVGLLLLKKASNLTASLITCAVLHGLSVARYLYINLMISFAPETVLSYYTSERDAVSAGMDILGDEPEFLQFRQNEAIAHILISFAILALLVVFFFVKARHLRGVNGTKITTLGSILMILSVAFLWTANSYVSSAVVRLYFGNATMAGIVIARNLFSGALGVVCVFLFLLLLADAVLRRQTKKRMRFNSVIGGILLLGLAAYVIAKPIMIMNKVPARELEPAVDIFQGMAIGGTAVFIAAYVWFHAVSKNCMPTWVQIAWPLALPILYFLSKLLLGAWFRIGPGEPYGLMIVAFLTIVFSSFRRSNKKTPLKENQAFPK